MTVVSRFIAVTVTSSLNWASSEKSAVAPVAGTSTPRDTRRKPGRVTVTVYAPGETATA